MQTFLYLLVTLGLLTAACSSGEPETGLSDLPDGDVASGAQLFEKPINGVACTTCHRIDDVNSAGPGMAGYGGRAGDAVSDESAEEYTYYSILRPSRHIVNGFSNVMPSDYEEKLTDQQVADLIAYLLTL